MSFSLTLKRGFRPLVKAKSDTYTCIECGHELHVRDGDLRRKHFAHNPLNAAARTCSGSTGESFEHKLAKRLVSEHLAQWTFRRECTECDKVESFRFCTETAVEEFKIEAIRLDVGVLTSARVCAAAIEIHWKHWVDTNKEDVLGRLRIPMFEVEARHVIQAFADQSFTVASPIECKPCQDAAIRRSLRPCGQCLNYKKMTTMIRVRCRPLDPRYPVVYACSSCVIDCPTCHLKTTERQLQKERSCSDCVDVANAQATKWLESCSSTDIRELDALLRDVPLPLKDSIQQRSVARRHEWLVQFHQAMDQSAPPETLQALTKSCPLELIVANAPERLRQTHARQVEEQKARQEQLLAAQKAARDRLVQEQKVQAEQMWLTEAGHMAVTTGATARIQTLFESCPDTLKKHPLFVCVAKELEWRRLAGQRKTDFKRKTTRRKR